MSAVGTHMGAIAAQIRQHCNEADLAEQVHGSSSRQAAEAELRMWDVLDQAPLCDVTDARDALIAAVLLRDQAIAMVEADPAEGDVVARVAQVRRFSENLIRGLEQMAGAKAAELLPWFTLEG